MFSEIWQIRDYEFLVIDNFKLAVVTQRENQRGGGVIIFVRTTLKYEVVDHIFTQGVIETAAIKIGNIIFMSLYRPPSGNKLQFIDKLIEWIENKRGMNFYIAGDFNLNYLGTDRELFEKIKNETEIMARITQPTRHASNTCIDNILSNIEKEHAVSTICIADHQGLTSRLYIESDRVVRKKHTYREMSERNWSAFSQKLSNISIEGETTDDKWNRLSNDIKSAVESSFPLKISNQNYKFNMSQGLLKSKNKKNKLLNKYRRGEIEKEVYVRYNNIYGKLINKEQETIFKERLIKSGSNSKKKWKVLKDELKMKGKDDVVDALKVQDIEITDKSLIAKAFKTHFETCAKKLADEVPDSGECNILIDQQDEWGFTNTSPQEIIEIIDTMLPKNSCGFDNLTNRMLKKEKLKMSQLLAGLINETITCGKFPDVLKKAKVIPIFKKGEKTNMNNYRPISLLPVLSKVFEKVLNKQLTAKLDQYHLIDDNQYGFRPGHSTEDAVIKFIDVIEKAKSKHKFVISIHIDVSKAFDSCDHNIMKDKLKRIGLNSLSMSLMSSYLKDRVQEVWIEEAHGGSFIINIGVGQGTVLGPTLFKIYIMDMLLATGLFSLRFADDTNLVGVGNSREQTESDVNRELVKLYKWFCQNKLTLHPDKSRYIIYTKDKLIELKLGGKKMMRCGYGLQEEGVKFLGVTIDENLDWKLQCRAVKKKVGKGNYLLWRYKNKLSDVIKKVIYESFVRTHLTYCLPVWGAKKTQELAELTKTLKRVWRKIGPRMIHTNERLKEFKILKLEDEIKLAEMKIVYRWEKKRIPLGLKDIIVEVHSRTLRNRKFRKDNTWKQDSISYRLADRASKQIKEIEIAKSINGLKNKIKNKCFLVDYNTQCRMRNCFICTQN